MKKVPFVLCILAVLWLGFNACEKKGTNDEPPDNPGYYFPINFQYKWTYVRLNNDCEVSPNDSFTISVLDRNTRPQGSGWDLISAGGATTFVYHQGDTIFTLAVSGSPEPFRELVGPVKAGTFWRDTLREWEYYIMGFEDVYSEAAGGVYRGCAKVRRTSSDGKRTDVWWAPNIGKVKRTEINQSGMCEGEELRRLDKHPDFP